jgi:hypothetical protein
MRVLFLPEVREYLREASRAMYVLGYFGFLASAERYMEELVGNIMATLPSRTKRAAPPYFDKYGKNMFYVAFKKNKNTHWYVFFSIYADGGEVTYLVRYISNNHIVAQFL